MYRSVDDHTSITANKRWWDDHAESYQTEHRHQLGEAHFSWGPEGLDESYSHILGDVRHKRILELGCGAAQCSRWLTSQGAHCLAIDISINQLRQAPQNPQLGPTLMACHAGQLPISTHSMDVVFASYGAIQFVADLTQVFAEVYRVLRPSGLWAFSVTHPIRWAFPDDPTSNGLRVSRSYFDTRAYAEEDDSGAIQYVEHHRTLSQYLNSLVSTGFSLQQFVEPTWDDPDRPDWGGWSALRGGLIPGTALFVTKKPQPMPADDVPR